MHFLVSSTILYINLSRSSAGKKRRESEFECWNYLSTEKLASEKRGQVSKRLFGMVTNEFTPYCKPLVDCAKELHKVAFPGGDPAALATV